MMVPDHLTHYHGADSRPFPTLSALPDREAIAIMERMFREHEGNVLFERFRDPATYLRERRETEAWVRAAFVAKAGKPVAAHPIAMVLGRSPFLERHCPPDAHQVRIPLSSLDEDDVSFTFPDSMESYFHWRDRSDYFLPEYHGKVFTRSEILALVEARGMPEESWDVKLPPDQGAYIEAQVWNLAPLLTRGDGSDGALRPRWPSRLLDRQGAVSGRTG
jgi:hypothetical protein